MAQLLIKCPETGKDLPTGMNVHQGMDLSGFTNNHVGCPYCGKTHTWDGSDAFFAEE